jgi:hypothetical protein
MEGNRISRYLGLGALVAGALAYVSYLRGVLAVTGGADAAVVAAAAAFVGAGVGAALASPAGERVARNARGTAAFNALLFGVFAFVVGAVVVRLPLGAGGSPVVAAYVVAAALPLAFVGFALAAAFRAYADDATAVYGVFLAGSAAGVLLAAAAFASLGHAAALALAAVLAAVAGVSLNIKSAKLKLIGPVVLAACAVALPLILPVLFTLAPARDGFLGASGERVAASRWSAAARAEVVGSSADKTAGAFTAFDDALAKELPGHEWLTVDGRHASPVVKDAPSAAFTKKYVAALAGRVKAPEKALVVGGAGFDALALAALGAGSVDLVTDDAVFGLIKKLNYPEELLWKNRITPHGGDGRAFLRRNGGQYDLIALSPAAVPTPLEPASSLSAEYLLTVDAFREYYRELQPAGIISFTVREGARPSYGPKLAATVFRALAAEGELQPAGCVAVFRRGDAVTTLAKRGGFDALELEGLVGVAGEDFEPVYLPGRKSPGGDVAKAYAVSLTATGGGRLAGDDRPFPFAGSGRGVAWVAAAFVAVLAAVFLLLPLYGFRKAEVRTGGKASFGLYFLLVGASFAALATALGPKVAFYLGGGAWSGPAAWATFLAVAAAGSLWGGAVARGRRWLPFVVVVAATLLCILAYDALMAASAGWPLWVRYYVAIVLVALVGFFLGALAPMGLAAAAGREPATMPWCWAAYMFGFALAALASLPAATIVGHRVILAAAGLLAVSAWVAFSRAARSSLPPVAAEADAE